MESEQYRGRNQRAFYRVTYPILDRPILKLLDNEFEVIDISEKAIKFICKRRSEFKPDLEVQFIVTFHDNESLALEGKILKTYERDVVIYLAENIPFVRIIKEQRYLLNKYSDKLRYKQI